jgi:uncharacterized protein YjbI with pentapeptide repeats
MEFMVNSTLKQQHPNFQGNLQDLEAFMKLANSRIRSEEREQALIAWDAYKTERQVAHVMRKRNTLMREKFNASHERVVDLSGATLDGICIGYSNLRGVIFDGASMRGVKLKGAYMESASLRNVDLSSTEYGHGGGNAFLSGANLTYADLEGAQLLNADLSKSILTRANLRNADLSRANLSEAILVQTDLQGTNLTGSRIYGISAWDVKIDDDESKRRELIVTPQDQAEVLVDDIEVAQFIYMLLNRANLRKVINAVTKRGVLILGRFGDGGIDVLRAVADKVREQGYLPLLFDFAKPDSLDYTETVSTIVGLSRFVIVDLSGPSVPQELMAIAPHFEIPFLLIVEKGRYVPSMIKDFGKYPWVAKAPIEFSDVQELIQDLPSKVLEPAEEMLKPILKRKFEDYQ